MSPVRLPSILFPWWPPHTHHHYCPILFYPVAASSSIKLFCTLLPPYGHFRKRPGKLFFFFFMNIWNITNTTILNIKIKYKKVITKKLVISYCHEQEWKIFLHFYFFIRPSTGLSSESECPPYCRKCCHWRFKNANLLFS